MAEEQIGQVTIGPNTMARVFQAANLTNLSNMQAVMNAVEAALAEPITLANDGRWRQPAAAVPMEVRSADARLSDDGLIEVSIYSSSDPGPARHFRETDRVLLDEAHATELLCTLVRSLEQRRERADG